MISHQHLNLTYIRKLSAGNNAFVVRMLQTFCKNVPPGITDLVSHSQAGDMTEVRQHAHKLKTMFRYVGMEHVADDLERLEFQINDLSENERSHLVSSVETASQRAVQEAQNIILTTPV